jgi:predicted alpha-1,2-mannosidase
MIALSYRATQAQSVLDYVNPFIGTGANGHTFPGPTTPFGMIQLSPDTKLNDWSNCSGYHYSDSEMLGFSHTHLSGTGIGDLGDILLCPRTNIAQLNLPNPDSTNLMAYRFRYSHQSESAKVGYYSVTNLDDSIKVELTSTPRVGFHRYTFPKNKKAYVYIDIASNIYDGKREKIIENQFEVIDNKTIRGYKIVKGWAPLRKVYFYIEFSAPFIEHGAYEGKFKEGLYFSRTGGPILSRVGFENLPQNSLKVKVSLSNVSFENAVENSKELQGWDFESTVESNRKMWLSYLSKIQIEGTSKEKEIFYTSLYHTLIQPNNIADANGQYYGPDYKVHQSNTGNYYSTFSLWDTFRGAHPLYTIICPDKVGDMANTMLLHFKHNGYLPIWTLGGTENHCMVGNHAIPVLADAIKKGIKGFDYQAAYNAMKITSTKDHTGSMWNKNKYDSLGYMPCDKDWQDPSKTLDFSIDDWAMAQTAQILGFKEDFQFFTKRASFYKNQFNKKYQLTWPRRDDGSFKEPYNPKYIAWNSDFTEGNSWHYTFLVPQDPEGLASLFGGKKGLADRLDSLFNPANTPESKMVDVETTDMGQYAHSNEPSHHVAYYYNYADKPWITQRLVRKIMKELYTNKTDGICGNEDCGQMSAWYIFNSMGLYPVNPSKGIYDIGSPILKKASIQTALGKSFTIDAPNVSDKNIYIKSIKLNGKPLNRLYITHAEIENGGNLLFEMSEKPNQKLLK